MTRKPLLWRLFHEEPTPELIHEAALALRWAQMDLYRAREEAKRHANCDGILRAYGEASEELVAMYRGEAPHG